MKACLINISVTLTITSALSIVISKPVNALTLAGSFSFMGNSTYLKEDPKCKAEPGSPHMVTINSEFSIKKDPFNASQSFIKFTWAGSDCKDADKEFGNYRNSGMPWMSKKIPLTDKTILNPTTWKVERIEFKGELDGTGSSAGFFDFTTGTGMTTSGITPATTGSDKTTVFKITDFKSAKVPEPNSTLSLLALGTLGAASTLKRKLEPSQSTEKETTKVG
ncbi:MULTISPECIES: PEP-CTERM sorting domain-containing protein [Microcystis]|uniref:PEP-CTERM sorting domain-containing protein n=1 Tax=unclassified Microcystis TaxID=2643300 RepID=UPI0007769BFE|nr:MULTISPECIES: PEP-CTERM sorting domain-containing protein [Microcystis]BCU11307.1 hypothetical protein MAN88_18710 [Microcystis aeruginosa]